MKIDVEHKLEDSIIRLLKIAELARKQNDPEILQNGIVQFNLDGKECNSLLDKSYFESGKCIEGEYNQSIEPIEFELSNSKNVAKTKHDEIVELADKEYHLAVSKANEIYKNQIKRFKSKRDADIIKNQHEYDMSMKTLNKRVRQVKLEIREKRLKRNGLII